MIKYRIANGAQGDALAVLGIAYADVWDFVADIPLEAAIAEDGNGPLRRETADDTTPARAIDRRLMRQGDHVPNIFSPATTAAGSQIDVLIDVGHDAARRCPVSA